MNKSIIRHEESFGQEWTRTENQTGMGTIVGYHTLIRGWRVSVFAYDNRAHYWLRVEELDIDSNFVIARRDEAAKKLAYLLEDEDNDADKIVSKGLATLSSYMSNADKRYALRQLMYSLVKGNATEQRKRILKELVYAHDDLREE